MAAIFLLTTSCLSTQKTAPPPQMTVSATAPKPLAPMPILAQRIQVIERIIKENGMVEDDEKAAKEILSTYRALQMASSKSLTLEDQEKLIQKLFYSLMLVEGRFFEKNSNNPKHPPSRGSTLYIRELQFPLSKVESRKPAEIVTAPKPLRPMGSEENPTPITPPEDKRQKGMAVHDAEANLDFNLLFQEVNSLVKRRKYEEATRLLSKAERKTVAGPAREIILRAKEQIDAEKETAPMVEDISGRDAREIEDEAKHLLEQEKFEEAINRLDAARNTSSEPHEEPLTRLKDSAVTGLINRERNRAAKIFLDAKKTNDPTLKREKLSLSREILADLIQDYPDSSLIPTLEQNLQVVDQTMQALAD
jgi:hypothetical protein